MSRYSSVGVATGYELDSRGSILGREKGFLLLHNVQIVSRAYPGSWDLGGGGIKLQGHEADNLSPIVEIKNGGAVISSRIRLHDVLLI
jgi:hypothetical protein